MPRAPRVDVADEIYHVINRANGRSKLFHTLEQYKHFENLLVEARQEYSVKIFAYILMPNHWHLVLMPTKDGELQRFMQWLTLTHTQQYRVKTKTIGYGHLYQGRYKSFLVQKENYLLQLIKYVECNPLRARLVQRAEDWKWGSAYQHHKNTQLSKKLLDVLPISLPRNYPEWLNERESKEELATLRCSAQKGTPYGSNNWIKEKVKLYMLDMTTRKRGRPKNNEKGT